MEYPWLEDFADQVCETDNATRDLALLVKKALWPEISSHEPSWQMAYLINVDGMYPNMWLTAALRQAARWGITAEKLRERIRDIAWRSLDE